MKSYTFYLFALFAFAISTNNSLADNQKTTAVKKEDLSIKLIGEFKNWNLYTQVENGQKACFIVSAPIERFGTYKSRADQFLWVRYINQTIDEVSVTPGYQFKDGTHPEIAIYKHVPIAHAKHNIVLDAKTHKCSFKNEHKSYLFDITDKEQAWVRDIETDKKIVNDMIPANYAIVSAHSTRNTCSSDVYSLIGFTKAYNKMREECGKIIK